MRVLREIAEAIGRSLKIPVVAKSPEEAAGHFGWLAFFAGMDAPASSALTQQRLGWRPTGVGLISDLDRPKYSEARPQRNMARIDPHPRTQDTDSLEQIPQLAHVVRPVVLRQARGTCSSLGKLSAFDLLFAEPVSGA
jgi:hypothetical protein